MGGVPVPILHCFFCNQLIASEIRTQPGPSIRTESTYQAVKKVLHQLRKVFEWILDKVALVKVASDKEAFDKVASGQSSLRTFI